MYKHIVMWKLKDFAEKETKENNAKKMKMALEGLKNKINEIKNIEVGININDLEVAYDIVLISEFSTKDDLEIYKSHHEHLNVAEFIKKVRDKVHVVDYEC